MGESVKIEKKAKVLSGDALRKKEIGKEIADLRYQRKELSKTIESLTAEWYSIRAAEKITAAQELLNAPVEEEKIEVPA